MSKLRFLPDPQLDVETGQWADFGEVETVATTDADCPSLKSKPPGSEEDQQNKAVLVQGIKIVLYQI